MPERILLVEDDQTFRSILSENLKLEGYHVEAVADGHTALGRLGSFTPDLIILDLSLPDRDGLDLCQPLSRGGQIPIIILSARSQKSDKLKGLRLGAEDYITKPADFEELLARIQVILRRTRTTVDHLSIGRLVIDFQAQTATSGSKAVTLTTLEFRLLRYLAERPGEVVSREQLLADVWGSLNQTIPTRSIDQAIFRLRQKIERDPHHPEFIRTAHRDGYCLSTGLRRP